MKVENVNWNLKLAANFTLSEVVEWPKLQISMTPADRKLAQQMATDALTECSVSFSKYMRAATSIAKDAQYYRNWVNAEFPQYGGRIGFDVLSWLRSKEWEIYRRRKGGSQHVEGHAIDIRVANVPASDYAKVMAALYDKLAADDYNGGLAYLKIGKRWVFIHIDKGTKRRWAY